MISLETLLATDDVIRRYVRDSKDIYTHTEGTVKSVFCLSTG